MPPSRILAAPVYGTLILARIPRNWKKSSARLLVMSQLIIKGVAVWLRWSNSWNGQAYRRGVQLVDSHGVSNPEWSCCNTPPPPPEKFFTRNTTRTHKNHNLTLQTYQPRGNVDKFAFIQRSIPEWNKPPGPVVHSISLDHFQGLLLDHLSHLYTCWISPSITPLHIGHTNQSSSSW